MAKTRSRLFETRYFGLIISAFVVVLFYLLGHYTGLLQGIELKMLDLHFNLKTQLTQRSVEQGVTIQQQNPQVSPNIILVAIDQNSLDKFGKWPWPRYRFADFLNGFTRIKDQSQRERAIFLDVFFIDPDRLAYNDALLVNAIHNNGRVFLETVMSQYPQAPAAEKEFDAREAALTKLHGDVTHISGDWQAVRPFYGVQPPLIPYGEAAKGYGHANYFEDRDGIYRRQPLVAVFSQLIATIPLNDLTPATKIDPARFQRLEWVDKNGNSHGIQYPLTQEYLRRLAARMKANAPLKVVKTDQNGNVVEGYYVVEEYQDYFVPSITLSLALDYFHKTLSDVNVHLGKDIIINNPQEYDPATKSWKPFQKVFQPAVYDSQGRLVRPAVTRVLNQIRIPIDKQGRMLVNFVGPPSSASPTGHQTFPVRSIYGYAAQVPGTNPATWPPTRAVTNDILMVGAFAAGLGDQKPTPFGLMNGVEIHANALNTIIMDNFLRPVAPWVDAIVLLGVVMLVGFMTSRLSTIWSLIATIAIIVALFIVAAVEFDSSNRILDFADPAIAVLFAFITVVVYRVVTEERDKARIRDMFSRYVNPSVVDQILETPPELGGVDKELTVFFSDIRGFTTLSESMTPQELVNHLNVYLTAMTDIIMEFQGTLDKYEGDAVMCFWGAPLPQPDHALLACKCALKQLAALKHLNEGWPEEKRLQIGIGLNSGIMTVGNMGSLGRMNYTIMGDAVNLGARLEGTNKQYGTHVIISENTYGLVKDQVIVRELDNIRVKGKNKPVLIYELVDLVPELQATIALGDGAGRLQKGVAVG